MVPFLMLLMILILFSSENAFLFLECTVFTKFFAGVKKKKAFYLKSIQNKEETHREVTEIFELFQLYGGVIYKE